MTYCSTCKIGVMKPGSTTVTFDNENRIVVFGNVPAQVCTNCYDYTFEETIAKSLLKSAREERAQGHEISVVNYKKAA